MLERTLVLIKKPRTASVRLVRSDPLPDSEARGLKIVGMKLMQVPTNL
jgi:nucleoside diphosphate kinase